MARLSEFSDRQRKEFQKKGVSPGEFEHADLREGDGDGRVYATYGHGKHKISVNIPAPSQGVIDGIFCAIAGAAIATVGVVIGVLVGRDRDRGV